MGRKHWLVRALLLSFVAVGLTHAAGPIAEEDLSPINYATAPVNDPIARFQKAIDGGQARLEWEAGRGYLRSLLKNLKIDESSQVLVFSKTSFQARRISYNRPRALYFNDDVYVGWVQQGVVTEFTAMDPQQGPVYYSLDERPMESPRFVRELDNCRLCHSGASADNIPGLMIRSVYANRVGETLLRAKSYISDHTSPISQRWGGWFVTGTSGAQVHMGNLTLGSERGVDDADLAAGTNLTNLASRIEVEPYLTPHSDIVALMVLEHQVRGHNLLTRANWETRRALHDQQQTDPTLDSVPSPATLQRIKNACEPLVMYLLFANEAKLTGPIQGTSTFAADFMKRGPFDEQHRSLRDLDLKTRLLKYPLSWLIYSEAFDNLPAPAKTYIASRLHHLLSTQQLPADLSHLTPDLQTAIRQIITATKPGLLAR